MAVAVDLVNRFGEALDAVVAAEPATPVVRYEDLTSDPTDLCRRLCDHLGVPYHPQMLDYGRYDHGPFVRGVGDWSERIRSGRVHARAGPDQPRPVPAGLADLCRRWGYPVAT
jgi:hypothetical protein